MHVTAIENWLARMHRHALSTGHRVCWRFHVQQPEPGWLETSYPECRPLIIRSPCQLSNWRTFFSVFARVCRQEQIDIVHVHGDLMSAPYVIASRLAGVGLVITHIHNADETIPTPSLLKRRLYREPARCVCLAFSDRIVGISDHTLDTFLSGHRRRPGRDVVHYYGVDPAPFRSARSDRAGFRLQLRLPRNAQILLFGGRLVPEKNPTFVVDVLARLRSSEPRACAVFAGTGPLEHEIMARARELGVGDAVRLLGWRNDLPEIMSCSDWFILPRPERPMEGFGLAVVEAQLAGLRLLLSHGIADDPLLPSASFRRLALADGAERWAQAALELLRAPSPSREDALAALQGSPMDMDRALSELLALYE